METSQEWTMKKFPYLPATGSSTELIILTQLPRYNIDKKITFL